jgi:hypothetical protein
MLNEEEELLADVEETEVSAELALDVEFDPAEVNADFDDDFDDDFESEADHGYDAVSEDGELL